MSSFVLFIFKALGRYKGAYISLPTDDSTREGCDERATEKQDQRVKIEVTISERLRLLAKCLTVLIVISVVTLVAGVFVLAKGATKEDKAAAIRPEAATSTIVPSSTHSRYQPVVCGNSPTEARKRGCHFELITLSWVAHDCHDHELVERYSRNHTWQWYHHETAMTPMEDRVVKSGELHEVWTTSDYREALCSYALEKLQRDVVQEWPRDGAVLDTALTSTCAGGQSGRDLDTKRTLWQVRYPICGGGSEEDDGLEQGDAGGSQPSPEEQMMEIIESGHKLTEAEVAAIYDQLGPVSPQLLMGEWLGGSVDTGLAKFDSSEWAGKSFRSTEDVDPVMVYGEGRQRQAYKEAGHARVREVNYRGVVSAAMVYDRFAVIDNFRYVSDDLIAGAMDNRAVESEGTYFFYIKRIKEEQE